jgi:tripartite-type tricarboxylate transporter receptor subunit TctC
MPTIAGWRVLAACASLIASNCVLAQSWPAKPIRIIVPFQVVGASGTPARGLAEFLPQVLGQPIVVENRPGSNGVIGMELCAKSAPDGYTFCVTNASTISSNPFIYAKLPYDPPRDFTPIVQIGRISSGFVVHPSLQVSSIKELFDLARAKPGSIAWASSGFGSSGHLYFEYFKSIGVPFYHVPFKTIDQSALALLSGDVQAMTNSIGVVEGQVRAGKLRMIAAGEDARSPFMPDLPSYRESGFTVTLGNWVGAFAPAGTPASVIQRMNSEINKLLIDPRFRDNVLAKITMEPSGGSSQQFADFLKGDRENYARLIKAAGIKPE